MLKWLLLLVLILGGGASAYYYIIRNAKRTAEAQPPATAKVESGAIIKLPFEISDSVKKDSLLVEVDPVYALRSVSQTEVSLSAAEANLEKARQNVILVEKTLVTDRLRAEAAQNATQAQLQYARGRAARLDPIEALRYE